MDLFRKNSIMIKSILYVGNDLEFLEDLKNYAKKTLQIKYEILHIPFYKGCILYQANLIHPNIIVFDASQSSGITEELCLLKTISKFKGIMVAAICTDQEETISKEFLLVSGAQLFHIKGIETEQFLSDCFFIAFEERSNPTRFAKAINLNIDLEVGFLSCFTSSGTTSFTVECDLHFENEIKVQLPFIKDAAPSNFKIEKTCPLSYVSPCLETIELNYPFPGPWDEIQSDTIQKETIESWLFSTKDSFDRKNSFISIVSSSISLVHDLFINTDCSSYIDFHEIMDEDLNLSIRLKMPELVLIEQVEDSICLAELESIIKWIKENSSYEPLIVILNNATSSIAMRKTLGYEKTMTTSDKLSKDLLLILIQKFYSNKKTRENINEKFFLRKDDQNRVVSLLDNINITALTEHEVTFKSKLEIPMFSVMKFVLPLSFYVTIIPTESNSKGAGSNYTYQGIIHGMNDENLNKIRKIVNQLIYNPHIKITTESVDTMLKQDYVKKAEQADDPILGTPLILINSPNLENDRREVSESESKRYSIVRNLKVKSKL